MDPEPAIPAGQAVLNEALYRDIGLILDVADTVHDMVHPVSGNYEWSLVPPGTQPPKNAPRCKVYGPQPSIYNRDLFLDALAASGKYDWLKDLTPKRDFSSLKLGITNDQLRTTLCRLVAMLKSDNKPQPNVKIFLKEQVRSVIVSADGTRAKDYEDAVMYYVNKLLDEAGRTDNYQNVNEWFGKFNHEKQPFMIDFLPGGVPQFQNLPDHMYSIATLWDPSLKMGLKPSRYESVNVTPVGTSHVAFKDDNVDLTSGGVKCQIPKHVLQSRAQFVASQAPYFRNSVGALCDLVDKARRVFPTATTTTPPTGRTKTIPDEFRRVVFNTLFCKPDSLENKSSSKKRPLDPNQQALEEYIKSNPFFTSYVNFLYSKDMDELIFKVSDMKRSGDYGQISAVKKLNETRVEGNKMYLLTGDRLCYLRCKLEGVHAVLLKPKNETCVVYPFTTQSADMAEKRTEFIKRLADINTSKRTITITINVPSFSTPNLESLFGDFFMKLTQLGGSYTLNVDIAPLIGKLNSEIGSLVMRDYHEMEKQIVALQSLANATLLLTDRKDLVLRKSLSPREIVNQGIVHVYSVSKEHVPALLHPICDALNRAFDFCSADVKPDLHYPSETYRHVLTNKDLFTEMVYRSINVKHYTASRHVPSRSSRRSYVPKELLDPFKMQLERIYNDIEDTIDATFSQYGTFEKSTPSTMLETPIFTPPTTTRLSGGKLGTTISKQASVTRGTMSRQASVTRGTMPIQPAVVGKNMSRYNQQHHMSARKDMGHEISSRHNLQQRSRLEFGNAWPEIGKVSARSHRLVHIPEDDDDFEKRINEVVDQLFYVYDMADFAFRLGLKPSPLEETYSPHLHFHFMTNIDLTEKMGLSRGIRQKAADAYVASAINRLYFDAVAAFPGHVCVQTKTGVIEYWDVYDVAELIVDGQLGKVFAQVVDVKSFNKPINYDSPKMPMRRGHSFTDTNTIKSLDRLLKRTESAHFGGFTLEDGTPGSRSRLNYRFIHRSEIGMTPFRVYDALMGAYEPSKAMALAVKMGHSGV